MTTSKDKPENHDTPLFFAGMEIPPPHLSSMFSLFNRPQQQKPSAASETPDETPENSRQSR